MQIIQIGVDFHFGPFLDYKANGSQRCWKAESTITTGGLQMCAQAKTRDNKSKHFLFLFHFDIKV